MVCREPDDPSVTNPECVDTGTASPNISDHSSWVGEFGDIFYIVTNGMDFGLVVMKSK